MNAYAAVLMAVGVSSLLLGLTLLLPDGLGTAAPPAWLASAELLASDPAPAAMIEYRRLAQLPSYAGSAPSPPGRPAPAALDGRLGSPQNPEPAPLLEEEGLEELGPDELGTEEGALTATPPTGADCPDCQTPMLLYAVGAGVRHLRCPACDRMMGEAVRR